MNNTINSTFEVIRYRRAVRKFSRRDVPDYILKELLELANTAPSGFNLQPWHFILLRDQDLKTLLKPIAMNQAQVTDAPAVIVFVADPDVWQNSYNRILKLGLETGLMSEARVNSYRKSVNLLFRTGPLGLFGFAKKVAVPLMRILKPTPNAITSRVEAIQYVRCQTMLAAATFMIAAKSAGLDTSPMEGFDEERLKKLLAIPQRMTVPIIIPVGYPLDGAEQIDGARLPIYEKLSLDLFTNKVG